MLAYREGQVSCVAFHVSNLPEHFFGAVLLRLGPERNPGDFLISNEGIELLSIVEQTGPRAAVGLASVAADRIRFSPHQNVFALELLLAGRVVDSECVTHLITCLTSGSRAVQLLAANICGEYGHTATNTLPILKKLTTSWRRSIRKAAAAAVVAIEEDS